jgi:hypothetical protein
VELTVPVRRYLPLVQLTTNADRLVVQAIVGLKVPDFPKRHHQQRAGSVHR